MGLLTKVFLLLIALVTLGLGVWLVSLLIFAYLLLSPLLWVRGSRSMRRSSGDHPVGSSRLPLAKTAGVLLVFLALAGVAAGGTSSPFVFGVPGVMFLAAPVVGPLLASRAKPVADSILLRGTFVPFRWFAVASVKASTRDLAGALSGLSERILVLRSPAEVFVVFSTFAFGSEAAQQAIFEKMRSAAMKLSPLGVYLLPWEGRHAEEPVSLRSRMKLPREGLTDFLSSADYESVLVEGRNGVVGSIDLHGGAWGASALSRPASRPGSTLLMRGALEAALQRSTPLRPDEYAIFLSSMAATVGETLGQRVVESEVQDDDKAVAVSSPGTPKVLLSRAQFRAVASVYE